MLLAFSIQGLNKIYSYDDTMIFESTSFDHYNQEFVTNEKDGLNFAFTIISYEDQRENIEDPDIGVMTAYQYGWEKRGIFKDKIPHSQCKEDAFTFDTDYSNRMNDKGFYPIN